MTPRQAAWALVAALAAVALGLWVYNQGEWVEHEMEVGLRGEAARNPYLAAGRFLRAMGVPAREVAYHQWVKTPPPDVAVLIVTGERLGLAAAARERLLEWVAAGGHLVVRASRNREEGEEDALLRELGLAAHHYGRVKGAAPATVGVGGTELAAEFRGSTRLAAGDGFPSLGEDDYGAVVVQGPWGRGTVTVLADFGPFTNPRVGEHDHAELLLRLVAPGDAAPVVALSLDEDMPGLVHWLWQRIPETLLALVLALVLFLWWRGHRFGRLADLPSPARRSLLEHIEAGGWFLWRRGHGARQLRTVRDALLARAAGRVGGLARRPEAEQVRLIARMSGLDRQEVAAALELPANPSPQEFIRHAATLEAIRKKL